MSLLAFLFIFGSLYPLVYGLGWPIWREAATPEPTYVFLATVDGRKYTSYGLSFEGRAGHWLRLGEVAVVLAAAALSLQRQDGLRRLGLLALTAWAGLWLANAARMAVVAPIWVFFIATGLMAIFFAANVGRAALCWRRRAG